MAKRRNPADSTTRNIRAGAKRDTSLRARLNLHRTLIKALQAQVSQLREQLAALFEAKRKQDNAKLLYAVKSEPRLLKKGR